MSKHSTIKFVTYQRITNVIKTRLTTIQTAVNGVAELSTPLTTVQIRTLGNFLVEIKKKHSDFESNLSRVLEHLSDEEAPQATLAEDENTINDIFIQTCSVIEALLPGETPSTSLSIVGEEQVKLGLTTQVKLPKLELRNFDGNPTQWVSFINLFDTTVHQNSDISNVAKMQYLISTLNGEPLSLIKSLNISAVNYEIAYNLLRERYHSPRRLMTIHLNQLIDLPNITVDSTKNLRLFVNMFFEHTQALKALDCEISPESNPLLSALILRKMDNDLRKGLESYRSRLNQPPHTLPDAQSIIKFLNEECSHNEDAILHQTSNSSKVNSSQSYLSKGLSKPKTNSEVKGSSNFRKVSMMATHSNSPAPDFSTYPCFLCQQIGHKIYTCPVFKGKSPQERYKLVKTHQRCVSCLGSHSVKQCTSKSTCLTCHKKHHSMLHFDIEEKNNSLHQFKPKAQENNFVAASAQQVFHPSSQCQTTVLLGTTLVKLIAPNGNSHVFRALLDSGSMCDFLSERAAQLLGTPRYKSFQTIIGISQTPLHTKGSVKLDLFSLNDCNIASKHQFCIVNKISADLPRTYLAPEVFEKVNPYPLADPSFHLPGAIDVLLGGALFPKIFTQESHSLGQNMPHVVGTVFGFVVMGSAPCALYKSPVASVTSLVTTTDHDLHSSLQRFWNQEEPPAYNKKNVEEEICDAHFNNTHLRDPDGRYIVRLPFKDDYSHLGSSYSMAERRLCSLERKFDAQPNFSELYHEFINEYISLGHMEKIDDFDKSIPHYFLPHHGVLKENSSTTKLRTVFDASCKTSTGLSLNDILLTGSKLQTNICDILLHFRSHNIVFACDIRQMYRQIKVHPDDRKFQLILWRDNPTHEILTYQLNTVTYGMNSSPYLAIKTLHQLAEDEGDCFPDAAQVLNTQTYVDDIITGADSEEAALELQDQLIRLLRRGGFELRKWISNSQRLLQALPKAHCEVPRFLQESQQPQFSILGLQWSPSNDYFTYNLNFPLDHRPTKRSVLSLIAKIYDPCGHLAPYIMMAKCFMQLLWTSGLNWDDPLPVDLALKWQTFVTDSKAIATIQIPRAFQFSLACTVEFHGFSDASESGYAAVLYFRCQCSNGAVVVRQILAKTRVAPLKRVTLPRLELCGAFLLAQLVAYCFSIFTNQLSFANTYLWCDSSVVLSWLKTPSFRLKTYVANRVAQIQEIIPYSCWRHVQSQDNSADCASRGILASHLHDHSLWWNGPEWLSLSHDNWPSFQPNPNEALVNEETKPIPLSVLITTTPTEWEILSKFSSWTTLQYVIAYTLRFAYNCRHLDKHTGPISPQELDESELHIIKLVQSSTFSDDIDCLVKKKHCSVKLSRLSPFLDSRGVLRVGGRLSKAAISSNAMHPILLPKQHHITNLIIDYYHRKHLHSGPQLTQAIICRKFWILCARSIIRSRIFKCVTCFKVKPINNVPLMGDLPAPRVTPARPFLFTGIDYCGPFNVKVVNLRSLRLIKVYICVFVCLVTKAVHLEVVTDMTTESFIATLTRFVSRRGLCSDIYSDCGSNFIGANSVLRKIIDDTLYSADSKDKILRFSTSQRICFHFNPPSAPHQGGLWESAVKSTKYHLRRVMGETVLTLMDFITLVTQIEAMLNSRPLTPLSNDPTDLAALSPGHFLIGDHLSSIPQPDLQEVPVNRLKQWHLVQALFQRIWHRWQLEYLHTLMQRSKWTRSTKNLKIGDLVLIHSNSTPLTWPLARIIAIHPGNDGVVRVVQLKTANGQLTRPAVKVFPLPIN